MKAAALLATAAFGLAAPFSLPSGLHLPMWAERILWNPRERTERAISELESIGGTRGKDGRDPAAREARRKAAAEALAAEEVAERLAPEDPTVQYDAGTLRLLAGKNQEAIAALERAARAAPKDLAADANFNLGTGKLAAGDAAGAVAALEQALRLDPGHAAAKHNLELALIEREQERLRAKKPEQGSRGDRGGGRETGPRSGGEGSPSNEKPNGKPNDPGAPPQQKSGGETSPRPGPRPKTPGTGDDLLDRFRDQPDMNAREAAAILRSVERLEREQRRVAAEQRARTASEQGADWQDW